MLGDFATQDRMMEVASMAMEAMAGFDHKFTWALIVHSGDGMILLPQFTLSLLFPGC